MLTLNRYVTAVSTVGIAVLVAVLAGGTGAWAHVDLGLLLLFVALVIGECLPMRIVHHGSEGEITTSSTFALALLIIGGVEVTMLAMTVAAIVADLRQRKSLSRTLFNVGQYALAVGAAALALSAVAELDGPHPRTFGPDDLGGAVLAAFAFFAVNALLVARAVSLVEGQRFWAYLRADLEMQTSTVGILLGLAPILVITVAFSPLAVPLLALPLVALHRSGRQAISHQRDSLTDRLTGLPNRVLLGERLDQALLLARREGSAAAVMFVDLDKFKDINDTLGHHKGDQLLVEVAARLRATVGTQGTVARLGGDEFAIALPGCTAAGALATAAELAGVVERPFHTGEGLVLHVRASIGVAVAPLDGEDADTLMRHADAAMYRVKGEGGGAALYAAELDEHSPEQLRLASELRDAIDQRALVMHFQPKVALRSGRMTGLEALVRWPHPRLGLLAPDAFLDLAARAGLMPSLTSIALDRALAECRSWLDGGIDVGVAVNLTAESLADDRIVTEIEALLVRHAVPGRLLTVELTEESLVADLGTASRVLGRLRAAGVRVAIDDFGTGYSALAHLRDLPVDELKIDRSFVAGLDHGTADIAIVGSTIRLAHDLGLTVVAEGVESGAVLARLTELGCDAVQGYLLGRPAAGEDVWERFEEPARAELTAAS